MTADARCCIRRTSIRLKCRIGPETDARRIAKIATTAKLMGVPVNASRASSSSRAGS